MCVAKIFDSGVRTATSFVFAALFLLTGCNFFTIIPASTPATQSLSHTGLLAPTSLSYSVNPAIYTEGVAIPVNSPSNSGGVVTSYSVSPALPAGLTLNPITGVISGAPQSISQSFYTITGSNSGGSTSVVLPITVNATAPGYFTYASNPATYTKGLLIASNSPSNGGTGLSYSVSPSLPAGLNLNSSTGVISGTPTAVTAQANYTIVANNVSGSLSAVVSITVNDVAPSALTYALNIAIFTEGVAIAADAPNNQGGTVVTYSVSPALPAGLTLNPSTGAITGTPTVISSATGYTVTAANSGGSTTAVLLFTVNAPAPTSLTYSSNPAVYVKGTSIQSNIPAYAGGPPYFLLGESRASFGTFAQYDDWCNKWGAAINVSEEHLHRHSQKLRRLN